MTAMRRATRVAIVDDHRFLAQTLSIALQGAGFDVATLPPGCDIVARINEREPDVVLLDLNLGSGPDGDDLIAPLSSGGAAVVVLTGETDIARWGECLLAGAAGVLPKSSPLEAVVAACSVAAEGGRPVSDTDRLEWLRAADRHRLEQERSMAPFRTLTTREQEVLAALIEGDPAATIAAQAVVSEATVRTQIRSLLCKLGVGSQLQAVARARRAGWSGQATS